MGCASCCCHYHIRVVDVSIATQLSLYFTGRIGAHTASVESACVLVGTLCVGTRGWDRLACVQGRTVGGGYSMEDCCHFLAFANVNALFVNLRTWVLSWKDTFSTLYL